MPTIKLILSYDGTDFHGWQRQRGDVSGHPLRTVQGEVEAALSRIHGVHTAVSGSGRTDAGVHAAAQAAHFESPLASMPAANYTQALNSMLSHDVRIISSEEVPAGFHARFSAVSRTYRYFICCGREATARERPYVWQLRHMPNLSNLNSMAGCLSGEMDVSLFASAQDMSESKHRYIEKAAFYPEGDLIVFEITANAFLWKMVRSITGSLIDYDRRGLGRSFFKEALASKDRRLAGATAPAAGLFLWSVSYSGTRRHGPHRAC